MAPANRQVVPTTPLALYICHRNLEPPPLLSGEVQALVKVHGFDVNEKDACGFVPLHWAVIANNEPALEALLTLGAAVNEADGDGQTPLYHASQRLDPEGLPLVTRLLAAGALPNLTSNKGEAPLMAACLAGSCVVVAALLAAGADPKHATLEGTTAVDLAGRSPEMRDMLLQNIRKKDCKQDKLSTSCNGCGAKHTAERPLKACSRCRAAMYCCPEHQKGDWSVHKKVCQAGHVLILHETISEGFGACTTIGFVLQAAQPTISIHEAGVVRPPPSFRAHQQFVVKCQVPLGHGGAPAAIMVYNEDRSLTGYLRYEAQPELHNLMETAIRSRGIMGVKGYFFATYVGRRPAAPPTAAAAEEAAVKVAAAVAAAVASFGDANLGTVDPTVLAEAKAAAQAEAEAALAEPLVPQLMVYPKRLAPQQPW